MSLWMSLYLRSLLDRLPMMRCSRQGCRKGCMLSATGGFRRPPVANSPTIAISLVLTILESERPSVLPSWRTSQPWTGLPSLKPTRTVSPNVHTYVTFESCNQSPPVVFRHVASEFTSQQVDPAQDEIRRIITQGGRFTLLG